MVPTTVSTRRLPESSRRWQRRPGTGPTIVQDPCTSIWRSKSPCTLRRLISRRSGATGASGRLQCPIRLSHQYRLHLSLRLLRRPCVWIRIAPALWWPGPGGGWPISMTPGSRRSCSGSSAAAGPFSPIHWRPCRWICRVWSAAGIFCFPAASHCPAASPGRSCRCCDSARCPRAAGSNTGCSSAPVRSC